MLSLSLADRVIRFGHSRLELTERLFELYCFLGYRRSQGLTGYASCSEIRRLPAWAATRPESIGKDIYRHVGVMRRRGCCLIESPPRAATKLFRLVDVPLVFDRPLPEVRGFLGLDLSLPQDPREIKREMEFGMALATAGSAFERGWLGEARAALETAQRLVPVDVRKQVHLLIQWSRLLEREGDYAGALEHTRRAVQLANDAAADYLTLTRALIASGRLTWLSRRTELYDEGLRCYARAQRLLEGSRHFMELSQIATGFGHLARRRQRWRDAIAHFLVGFEYAATDTWAWGIEASLFNLGVTYAEWADRIRRPAEQKTAYEQARAWLEICERFSKATGVGSDATEGQAALAHVLVKLGNGDAALQAARRALEGARRVGNRRSEAVALTCLGQSLAAVGDNTAALAVLREAQTIYAEIAFAADVERVERMIHNIREQLEADSARQPAGAS
jgi:tetratricopeptide (TPR) repeat protein